MDVLCTECNNCLSRVCVHCAIFCAVPLLHSLRSFLARVLALYSRSNVSQPLPYTNPCNAIRTSYNDSKWVKRYNTQTQRERLTVRRVYWAWDTCQTFDSTCRHMDGLRQNTTIWHTNTNKHGHRHSNSIHQSHVCVCIATGWLTTRCIRCALEWPNVIYIKMSLFSRWIWQSMDVSRKCPRQRRRQCAYVKKFNINLRITIVWTAFIYPTWMSYLISTLDESKVMIRNVIRCIYQAQAT